MKLKLLLVIAAALVTSPDLAAQAGAGVTVVSRPGAVAVVIAAVRARGLIIDSTSLIAVGGFTKVAIDSLMAMIPPGAILGAVDRAECRGSRETYCMMFSLTGFGVATDTAYVRANWGPVAIMSCAGVSAVFKVVMDHDFPVLVSKTDEVIRKC